jgi:hypothetical protein
MRQTIKRVALACLVTLGVALSGPAPVSIKAYPAQSFAPATIRITVHVTRAPENRSVVWGCASEDGMSTQSELQLEGENSVATTQVFWKDVSEGEYTCRAGVGRQGLEPLYASPVVFHVLGR